VPATAPDPVTSVKMRPPPGTDDHVPSTVRSAHAPSTGWRPVDRVAPSAPPEATGGPGGTVGSVDINPGPDPGDADAGHPEGGAPYAPDDVTGDGHGSGNGPTAAADGDSSSDAADGATADAADGDPGPHDPLRFNQWMKRSATGAVLSGIALGLQQALEPKRELPAFVMEAPGGPEDPDAPITLHFDPDDPTKTVAVIRGPGGLASPAAGTAAPDGGTDDPTDDASR